mmetsp:Transcript_16505/g.52859  ORF Transcript_16505/g.52859 Transcript_16505/m.52859 type:complete len:457 (+) Transcript_16505:82-1452(+)
MSPRRRRRAQSENRAPSGAPPHRPHGASAPCAGTGQGRGLLTLARRPLGEEVVVHDDGGPGGGLLDLLLGRHAPKVQRVPLLAGDGRVGFAERHLEDPEARQGSPLDDPVRRVLGADRDHGAARGLARLGLVAAGAAGEVDVLVGRHGVAQDDDGVEVAEVDAAEGLRGADDDLPQLVLPAPPDPAGGHPHPGRGLDGRGARVHLEPVLLQAVAQDARDRIQAEGRLGHVLCARRDGHEHPVRGQLDDGVRHHHHGHVEPEGLQDPQRVPQACGPAGRPLAVLAHGVRASRRHVGPLGADQVEGPAGAEAQVPLRPAVDRRARRHQLPVVLPAEPKGLLGYPLQDLQARVDEAPLQALLPLEAVPLGHQAVRLVDDHHVEPRKRVTPHLPRQRVLEQLVDLPGRRDDDHAPDGRVVHVSAEHADGVGPPLPDQRPSQPAELDLQVRRGDQDQEAEP